MLPNQNDNYTIIRHYPADFIHYIDDDGQLVAIFCYFLQGEHKGKSKGLVKLSKDLNMPISSSMKLAAIRNILSSHSAFQNVFKLKMRLLNTRWRSSFVRSFTPNWMQLRACGAIWKDTLGRKLIKRSRPCCALYLNPARISNNDTSKWNFFVDSGAVLKHIVKVSLMVKFSLSFSAN